MKPSIFLGMILSFFLLTSSLSAVTLGEKDLGLAELAMNEDSLARYMKLAMDTFDQPMWVYMDWALAFDPSTTFNLTMDLGLGDHEWGSVGYLFGLTLYMLEMRQAFFMDLGPYYGFSLTQDSTTGLNFFNGLNFYGKDWKIFTGLDMPLTQHSRVDNFPLSLYFFSDFSLLAKLLKPYIDIAIPTNLSNFFTRLAAGVETPFGTPGFRGLRTIGGNNYTVSYEAQLFPFPVKTMDFIDVGMREYTLDAFIARSFDVLTGEDFLKKFSEGKAQVFVATLSALADEETHGRFFISLHYTGMDGLGFQLGLESDEFAFIISKNAFLDGYYGTTLGLFSLYAKWVYDLNDFD